MQLKQLKINVSIHRLSFRFPDQNVIGQKQVDGKWNGFIGLIANEVSISNNLND